MTLICLPELLQNQLVFRKLSNREREDFSRIALAKQYDVGEFIALQGRKWPYVMLIDTGLIRVHKISREGREFGALRLPAGQVFWSPCLVDDGPLPASLQVVKDCEVFLWHKDQILPTIQRKPEALWELCTMLIQRMRQASEMVEDLAFQPVANRLAGLLIKEYQREGEEQVNRNLTLDEMAAMIGTTPVMVCKILSRFADQEIIRVSRTEFEFINWGKMEQIAGSD